MDLLFHSLMHSLVDFYMCLTGDRVHDLGVSGWCFNQLSYPARAHEHFRTSPTQDGAKEGSQLWVCETQSLFLHYYLLIILLFSIWTTVNLLLPPPVLLVLYKLLLIFIIPLRMTWRNKVINQEKFSCEIQIRSELDRWKILSCPFFHFPLRRSKQNGSAWLGVYSRGFAEWPFILSFCGFK